MKVGKVITYRKPLFRRREGHQKPKISTITPYTSVASAREFLDCSIVYAQSAVGFAVEILFTLFAGILPRRNPSHKSSLTICFYLKTIRRKLDQIALEGDVLLKSSSRLKPVNTPDSNNLS